MNFPIECKIGELASILDILSDMGFERYCLEWNSAELLGIANDFWHYRKAPLMWENHRPTISTERSIAARFAAGDYFKCRSSLSDISIHVNLESIILISQNFETNDDLVLWPEDLQTNSK